MAVLCLLSLWLRTGLPAHLIAGAGYDDRLFVRLGQHLLYGDWLGPFTDTTLVKGVGYPVFLALCFLAGVPVTIGECVVYLAVGALCAWAVGRLSRSWLAGGVLFAFLALNPVLWNDQLARIIREGLYVSLSLAALMAAAWLAFSRSASRGMWIASVATGLTWAWFWLTREEGVWLIPSVLLVSVVGVWAAFAGRLGGGVAAGRAAVARLGVALLVAAVAMSGVAAMNLVRYGAYETVEVRSTPFERAYGALSRVRPARWRRYVVFPADVRRKVYAVSPAARELSPYFEGTGQDMFRQAGCDAMPGTDCSEVLSGWFQWAFRDAVAAAGHYRSGASAAAYYTRLADEIDAACDRHALDCLPARASLAPPFRPGYFADAARGLPRLASVIWTEGLHPPAPTFTIVSAPGTEPGPALLTPMTDFVGVGQPTEAEAGTTRKASRMRSLAIFKLTKIIAAIYAPIFVAMIPLSLFGIVGLWARRRSVAGLALLTLVLACYVGVAVRSALLVYLDATAIPSINVLYWSPASPLLILAAVVGACVGLPGLVRGRRDARRSPAGAESDDESL